MPNLNDLLPQREAPAPAAPASALPELPEGSRWERCKEHGEAYIVTHIKSLDIYSGAGCSACNDRQKLNERICKHLDSADVSKEIDLKVRARLATMELDIAEAVQAQLNAELQTYAEQIRDGVTRDIRHSFYREERALIEQGYRSMIEPVFQKDLEAEKQQVSQREREARIANAVAGLEAERFKASEAERLSKGGAIRQG